MLTGVAGFEGQAPVVTQAKDIDLERRLAERAKYEAVWHYPQYRAIAPGESIAALFLAQARPKAGSEIIDFGAGTGRGALALAIMGMKVHMLDFAANCLDEEIQQALTTQAHALTFKLHDLNRPIPLAAQYGFCTDVMEHIPEQDVDRVLFNILKAAQHTFFQISCEDDVLGKLIGQPLHLSVHPYKWWHKKFQELNCTIHFSQDFETHCIFYVTAWRTAQEVVAVGVLNIDEKQIRENVKANIALGYSQVTPHLTNDVDVMILGGGPSLADHLEEIRELRAAGVKLITLNGSYNWALDKGLVPSAQIMVDARPFNARFSKPVIEKCKYFIASQCDPSVLEGLPKDRTFLWHTAAQDIKEVLTEHYDVWWSVPGGSTVMLRAIPLLRMLGFRRFYLFGFDSCLQSDYFDSRCVGCSCDASQKNIEACPRNHITQKHHAYAQPENDSEHVISVTCGDKLFRCHAWMLSQAQEFQDLVKFLGDEIELQVRGEGLIAHILKTGAGLFDQEV